ncbi:MAG: hypothetical protein IBJ18_00980 [Phycisphaerales bacterium]|nr:hypothetical protein [Phycisphaerales bacterium]
MIKTVHSFARGGFKSAAPVAAMLALAGSALAAVPTEWNYRLIARTGTATQAINVPVNTTFAESGVPNEIGLDENGTVAVRYVVNAGTPQRSEAILIYDKNSQAVSSVLPLAITASYYNNSIDLRDGKLVLTKAGLINSAEVRQTDGTLEEPISLGGPLQVYGQFTGVKRLNDGAVAYRASCATSPTNSGSTIKYIVDRTVNGERQQTALATCTLESAYSLLNAPAVSATGYMSTRAYLRAGGSEIARFRENQAPVSIFNPATSGGLYDSISDYTDVNASGKVAFFARRSGSFLWELLVGDGVNPNVSIASAVAWPGAGISNSGLSTNTPAINDLGMVVYRAEITGTTQPGNGLFISDGQSTFRLMREGQTIQTPSGSSLVVGFGTTSPKIVLQGQAAFNNAGDVAFMVRFADGTQGLVLASPTTPLVTRCQPADIADDGGNPLPSANPNAGVNEGDYNLFFAADGFFAQAGMGPAAVGASCDIANDDGSPRAPFGAAGTNNGVNEGDFNCFFNNFFLGCP